MTRTSQLPILKVDGGGLLFAHPRHNPAELAQAKVAAEGLVAGYNLIGYEAVGVGRLDLAAGLDFLKTQARGAKFAWLSANLVEPTSGKPLFTPFISRTLGATRVAIIGITSDQSQTIVAPGEATTIKPWSEALPPLVAKLTQSHDFLVLLTDLPPTECGAVARQFPAINLIIDAGGDAYNQPPRLLGSTTLLAATGGQGKYVGVLEVTWSPGGHWGKEENRFLALRDKEMELKRASDQLALVGDRPELASQAGNLRRRQSSLQEEIVELRATLAGVAVAFFTNTFSAMTAAVGEDPKVGAIITQIREQIGERGRKNATGAGSEPSPLPDFTGWHDCAGCHPKAAARWQSTGHARAYTTLEKKNRQFNTNCLLCHVTGGETVSTDRLASLPPGLRGVGCEVCHGPGRRHAEGREKSQPRRVPETLCRNCHVPEHDGHFDYNRNLELIRCDR